MKTGKPSPTSCWAGLFLLVLQIGCHRLPDVYRCDRVATLWHTANLLTYATTACASLIYLPRANIAQGHVQFTWASFQEYGNWNKPMLFPASM